jgi:3-hydroxybutyryl-CoA dehydratase
MIHFDELTAGERFTSARRTLTEADMMAFAGVTGDFNPLHTDAVFAREEGLFGARVVHGPLLLAMCFGLRSARDDWKILALVECRRRFVAPVFPGDTVHCRHTVEALRASESRPGTGVVTVAVEVVNQHDAVVQEGTDVLLLARDQTPR